MAHATSVEVLKPWNGSRFATAVLEANIAALKSVVKVRMTASYRGLDPWLMLYGVGDPLRSHARRQQLAMRRRVLMWDLGYFGRTPEEKARYARLSLDDLHPWRHFSATPNDPTRWQAHGISLREDSDPDGPVIVIGMGRKSREQLLEYQWEVNRVREAKARFPKRKVIYRPKRRESFGGVSVAPEGSIESALKGASLVICRHSNVAIDACIAGVPVECEDGAAYWLYRDNPNPTVDERLDFLHRLAHWQYRLDEMELAWNFIQVLTKGET